MKKYLSLIFGLIFTLCVGEVLARPVMTPQPVVYRGTVSGLRISAVDGTAFVDGISGTPELANSPLLHTAALTQANTRISAVDGTAFIDTADATFATNLSAHLGKYLVLRDSAGKYAKAWIKAAGSGETLGSEVHASANAISDPNSNEANATAGWGNGDNPVSLFESTASGTPNVGTYHYHVTTNVYISRIAWNPSVAQFGLYKLTYDRKLVSGGDVHYWISYGNEYQNYLIGSPWTGVNYTSDVAYFNTYLGTNLLVRMGTGGAGALSEFYFDNLSLKQITAPSTSGATIVTAKSGATYNWGVNQFVAADYNQASYTVVVRKLR